MNRTEVVIGSGLKIICSREELAQKLSVVGRGVSTRTASPGAPRSHRPPTKSREALHAASVRFSSPAARVYLSLPEVVERYAGVHSKWTIYELTRTGAIPHRKLAGRRGLLFPLDELEAFEDGAELETVEAGERIEEVVLDFHPAVDKAARRTESPAGGGCRRRGRQDQCGHRSRQHEEPGHAFVLVPRASRRAYVERVEAGSAPASTRTDRSAIRT
jgi:hypothetical protein